MPGIESFSSGQIDVGFQGRDGSRGQNPEEIGRQEHLRRSRGSCVVYAPRCRLADTRNSLLFVSPGCSDGISGLVMAALMPAAKISTRTRGERIRKEGKGIRI